MKRFTAILTVFCVLMTMFGTLNMTVSAAEWHDGWEVKAGDVTVGANGVVLVNSASNGEPSNYRKKDIVGSRFDIEWTMKVNYYTGTGTSSGIIVCLYNGSRRAYMNFYETGIWHRVYTGTTQQRGETLDYDIGYDEHTYRVICDGLNADLYIDGYFVKTFQIEDNPTASQMTFGVSGSVAEGALKVTNVTVHPYSGRGGEEEETEKKFDLSTAGWQTNEVLPVEAKTFDFDKPEEYTAENQWVLRDHWEVKDGYLQTSNSEVNIFSAFGFVGCEKGQDMVFKTRVKIPSWSYQCGINFQWPGYGLQTWYHKDFIDIYQKEDTKKTNRHVHSDIYVLDDGEWHEVMVKTYEGGSKVQLFIDGTAVTEIIDAYPNSYQFNAQAYYYTYPSAGDTCTMLVDWLTYEPVTYDIQMEKPMVGAEYLEGQDIELDFSVPTEKQQEIPSVEVQVNGETVATATAPEYKTVIPGLSAGTYEVSAVSGDTHRSVARNISVREAVLGEVETSIDGSANLFANLKFYDELPQISKVEYFLDGISVASATQMPYSVTIPGIAPRAHALEAVCYNKAGIVIAEYQKKVFPVLDENTVSTNYANEISYRVSGENGSATATYSNGRHQLKLTHTKDAVTYLTKDGEQTYPYGGGSFRIFTEGPFAEVYRNGHFAFSYCMPQATKAEKSFVENGLTMSEVAVSIPQERGNYFVAENVNQKQAVYQLADTWIYHLLEFQAGKGDEGHLALNDGYYRVDLTIENGKIYGWTADDDKSEPYKLELADVVESDTDVYYRVETMGGMSNLYANGKWLNCFRNVYTPGKSTLAVEVTKGDGFSYLAVSDYQDVYIFEDSFEEETEFASEDYWKKSNGIVLDVDTDLGHMSLNGVEKTNAIVDLFAYVGDADFEADVRVRKNTKGFWLVLNHALDGFYSKMGYNYETGNWEIVDITDKGTFVKTAEGNLPIGETVNLKVVVRDADANGKHATLYVNGNPVISQKDSPVWRGKMGFAITDGGAYIQRVAFRGDARPVADVRESDLSSTVDLLDFGDEGFVLANAGGGYMTKDGGKNWTRFIGNENMSEHMLVLQNGEALAVRSVVVGQDEETGKPLYNEKASISTDKGASWQQVGWLREEPWTTAGNTGNRITQGASGRIYFLGGLITDENTGNSVVFYSDDNGRTWTRSKTELDARKVGHVIQEGKVIELSNGIVRCYFRTDRGTVFYYDSHDYGETFDMSKPAGRTPFLSTTNCFNVELDPVQKDTLYLAWSLDNANLEGMIQYPRTRWSVAKSTDNGETWEYLGTYHENNYTGVGGAMMNLSIHVARDYVALEAMSRDNYTNSTNYSRTIVFPKEKEKGSVRFEQTHLKEPGEIDIVKSVSPVREERSIAIHKDSNSLLLRGKRVENAVYENALSLDCAVSYLGASIEDAGNGGIALKYGESSVNFGADALTERDGKKFISIDAFAKAYGLSVVEERGIVILSPYEAWSQSQMDGIRYALDFFTREP